MKRTRDTAGVLLIVLLLLTSLVPQVRAVGADAKMISPTIIQVDIDAAYPKLVEAKEGDRVIVLANQITGIPTKLLSAITGRDVTMVFDMIDYRWEVNGLSVRELPENKDNYYLRIKSTKELLPELGQDLQVMQFETVYKEKLPFLAKLVISVDEEYGGKLLYLYRFGKDTNQVTYSTMAFVNKGGIITLPFVQGGYFALTTGLTSEEGQGLFYDIGCHWAKKDINLVSSLGVFKGTSEYIFSPEDPLTRGMFVTLLGRLYKADVTEMSGFIDINEKDYWAPYIGWARKTGIVSGLTLDVFGPDLFLTREQAAVILKNFLTKEFGHSVEKSGQETTFSDNEEISLWAKESVLYMQEIGLMQGTGGAFLPAGRMTRAEGAAVLSRMIQGVFSAK